MLVDAFYKDHARHYAKRQWNTRNMATGVADIDIYGSGLGYRVETV